MIRKMSLDKDAIGVLCPECGHKTWYTNKDALIVDGVRILRCTHCGFDLSEPVSTVASSKAKGD